MASVAVAGHHHAQPKDGPASDLSAIPMPALLARLSSTADGLVQSDAETRLARDGPNEIEEATPNPLLKFLTYFWGPIPW